MDANELKQSFLKKMSPSLYVSTLFNLLPDVYFFLKDHKSRFIAANDLLIKQCGVKKEEDIIGKTDLDFFPRERALNYLSDDKHVMETGESIIDRVELEPDSDGSINWVITSKIPIYSHSKKIIGVTGIARNMNRAELALRPFTEMQAVLEYINANYSQQITVQKLAKLVNLSVSQFERRFRQLFNNSPIQHVMKVRIRAACQLLSKTNNTITSIAIDCGFYDHAHFTNSFKKGMIISPKEYRNKYKV